MFNFLFAEAQMLAPSKTRTTYAAASAWLANKKKKKKKTKKNSGGTIAKSFLSNDDLSGDGDDDGVAYVIPSDAMLSASANPDNFKAAVGKALLDILTQKMGYTGDETILPSKLEGPNVRVDELGNLHIRFQQYLQGFEIEDAAIVIHIQGKDGKVMAVNGEFVPPDSIEIPKDSEKIMDCNVATEIARKEYNISTSYQWKSDCQETAVSSVEGKVSLAYKRLLAYQETGQELVKYQQDWLFASRTTGDLLTVRPTMNLGWSKHLERRTQDRCLATTPSATTVTPSFETYDCKGQSSDDWVWDNNIGDFVTNCDLVSNSTNKIQTGNAAANDAHNNAIDVYDFYRKYFGRKSINDRGMAIMSYVHMKSDKNGNDGGSLFSRLLYGDAYVNDTSTVPESKCLDLVAWVYTANVVEFTSNLIWSYESGALLTSLGDIMGATIERLYRNKGRADVWRMFEDCGSTDGLPGSRDMANPRLFGDADFYQERYRWNGDFGGVHENALIVDKAFTLMVEGGVYPTNTKFDVKPQNVSAFNKDFSESIRIGAQLFYNAHTMCLTPQSDFVSLRLCTLMLVDPGWANATVEKAWTAVGISNPDYTSLASGIPETGIRCGVIGDAKDQKFFILKPIVKAEEQVTCKLTVPNGDGDLFVKFNSRPEGAFGSDCYSNFIGNVDEECQTRPAPYNSKAYVTVQAWVNTTDMILECYKGNCTTKGKSCTNATQCCGSMICDGPTQRTKKCKPCISPCDSASNFTRSGSCSGKQFICKKSDQCCKSAPLCNGSRCKKS